jgi:hypothetical protein
MIYLAIQTVAVLELEPFVAIQDPVALLAACQFRTDLIKILGLHMKYFDRYFRFVQFGKLPGQQ